MKKKKADEFPERLMKENVHIENEANQGGFSKGSYLRSPSFRRSDTAFTLIEMLTVVVVVALLAVLFFSALRMALNGANETVCMSNVHTYGAAVLAAIADNNGKLLPRTYVQDDATYFDFVGFVYPSYLQKVLYCPNCLPGGGYLGNYSIDGNLAYYFPVVNSCPIPHNRVVLVAECHEGQGYVYSLDLDITMWGVNQWLAPGDYPAMAGPGGEYHGSATHRG